MSSNTILFKSNGHSFILTHPIINNNDMAHNPSIRQPNPLFLPPVTLPLCPNTNTQKLSLHKVYQIYDLSSQSKYETTKN